MFIYRGDYILTKNSSNSARSLHEILLVKMNVCWARIAKMPDSYWPPTEGIPKSQIHAMPCRSFGISVTRMCDYRRGLDWWRDLLTSYRHDSELQTITAPPLISTIYKSPQHPLRLFAACCVLTSHSLAKASNSGDSSASRAEVVSSQPPVKNSTYFVPCL
jgi:hypothetical protein